MNRKMVYAVAGLMLFQASTVNAQVDKKEDVSEIIIHRDGGQEKKITVIIDGENVMINGKPMDEFNEEGVNIRRRRMLINDGPPMKIRGFGMINGKRFEIDGDNTMMDDRGEGRQRRSANKRGTVITFLGVQTEYRKDQGAYVNEVVPGSAAEAAGLKAGDLIKSVDNVTMDAPDALSNLVRGHKPDDKVEISFVRDGKKKKTSAVLQSKVISTETVEAEENDELVAPDEVYSPRSKNRFDIEMDSVFVNLDKKLKDFNIDVDLFPKKQKLGIKIQDTENEKGVVVLDVAEQSLAATAGLAKGDIITQIDGQTINNTDEARIKMHDTETKSSYFIKLLRNKKEMQLEIKTPKALKVADL